MSYRVEIAVTIPKVSGARVVEGANSISIPSDNRQPTVWNVAKWAGVGAVGRALQLDRLPRRFQSSSEHLLHLGCGDHLIPGFINADFFRVPFASRRPNPDWSLDVRRPFRCPSEFFSGIFSSHMVEQLTPGEVLNLFHECHRVLKPGGGIRIVVPDGERFARAVAGLCEVPENGFSYSLPIEAMRGCAQDFGAKSLWSGQLLCRYLANAGFVEPCVVEFGRGRDKRLLHDMPSRQAESVVVEAIRPQSGSR